MTETDNRRRDVGQPLLQELDGLDHLELLAGAGRAGDQVDAAMAQPPATFSMSKPTLISSTGSADSRHANRVADARPQQHAEADRRT